MKIGPEMIQSTIDCSLVAPVFNEEKVIAKVITSWIDVMDTLVKNSVIINYEIVICDDASSDNTLEILKNISASKKQVKILSNKTNKGAGYSLHKCLIDTSGDWVIFLDSDGQFDPDDIPKMLDLRKKSNIILGQRVKKSMLGHRLGSTASNAISRFMFNAKIRDFNCQLKIEHKDLLKLISLRSNRMNYSGEITIKLLFLKKPYILFDVNHLDRIYGYSNIAFFMDSINRLLFLGFLKYENYLEHKDIIRQVPIKNE